MCTNIWRFLCYLLASRSFRALVYWFFCFICIWMPNQLVLSWKLTTIMEWKSIWWSRRNIVLLQWPRRGNMICCDNGDCLIKWFHLTCLKMKEACIKKGKWYCPDCRTTITYKACQRKGNSKRNFNPLRSKFISRNN